MSLFSSSLVQGAGCVCRVHLRPSGLDRLSNSSIRQPPRLRLCENNALVRTTVGVVFEILFSQGGGGNLRAYQDTPVFMLYLQQMQ